MLTRLLMATASICCSATCTEPLCNGVADDLGHSITNECHLVQECEGFMAKGITGSGAGFDAPSMGRLGGRGPVPTHNPPAHQLKSAALKVPSPKLALRLLL